jgi:hypothetical protein
VIYPPKYRPGNNGTLSARKRSSHFHSLSEDEIAGMEQAVQAVYGIGK